ncbi:MAG: hypothetical protein K2I85_01650 [Alistipes sp.]|nr:hypothetical protein [Alistipes sp.]
MKRICLLFSVFALIACNKEDNGISVAPSELAGTYWKETQRLDYEYCDGLLTKKFENNFDGTAIGSAGPSVLFFRADAEIIKYGSLPPMGNQLDGYRQCRYFDFDPSQNIIRIYQDAATPEMELSLETCTSGKIVWSYGDDRTLNGHLYRIETRKTYRRYYPDDTWERSVAGYADYDEIDWSLYQ